nr:hypothetical protein [Tanacetum cinerariifolium]
SQNLKLEKEKAYVEAEAAFLKAQLSFPNVKQLTELMVQSLKPKISKLLTNHDFSAFILTELKKLPSKFSDIRGLLPHARGLGFKPRRGGFPSGAKKEWGLSPKVKVQVLHIAQLDVTATKALNRFAIAIASTSQTTGDTSVPSAGQASTHPAKGEKNTKQAIITQLF